MGSERFVVLAGVVGLFACSDAVPRFPNRPPMTRDPDLGLVDYPCRPDPKEEGGKVCAPPEYESFVYWDLADKSVFRPMSEFFEAEPAGEAVDVNSLDEVPDSSWFENRAGVRALTREEKEGGACVGQALLPKDAAPRSWHVDQGKTDGVTPGFRVKIEGVGKFMLKADRLATPYRASAAEVVGSRLYWAAGFNTPCNFVHAVTPDVLALEPGLEALTSLGTKVPFDDKALASVLEQGTPLEGHRVRMGVSRWLPGRAVGPFTYDGVREDDPHDVVPHERRRELRGARLMAAWIGHYDAREQNTMTTWMSSTPSRPAASPGYMKHWYLDFGDSLGTLTKIDDLSRRYGHTYLFDPGDLLIDFFTFGATLRPWEKATSPNKTFPYFTVAGFEPERWKPGYPNPAFSRMSEHDGAWMARIIARIDDETVAAAVRSAELPPADADYLEMTLLARRNAILRRYLSRLSPLGNLEARGRTVCALDLARRSRVFAAEAFAYDASMALDPSEPTMRVPLVVEEGGRVCASIPPSPAPRRLRLRFTNRQAAGHLDLWVVDTGGADGLRLIGARRPAP